MIVHDKDREIQIRIRDEPIRHLGSLNLPMEEIRFKFIDYTEDEASRFMEKLEKHMMRLGG